MAIAQREVIYKTIDDVDLSMHIFEPAYRDRDRPLAAIVFFFGGGWNSGSPEQFFPHCRHLAEQGMFAAAAEYRVKSRHGVSPIECVADGKSAVRYLYAHAAELGLDPAHIAAGGGSAGGHVAACTGIVPGQDDPADDLAVPSKPKALVLFNPVTDTTRFGSDRFLGRAEEFSPQHHISAAAPPTVTFHGTADTCVPHDCAATFEKSMQEAGVDCTLHSYDGRGHAFFNYGRDGSVDYKDTVTKMDAFLTRLGYLG